MALTTLLDIRDAADAIGGRVLRTPLLPAPGLRALIAERGGPVPRRLLLKAENLQETGSFKVRGVLNRIRALDDDERLRGLITISAGNHAAALAWAAAAQHVPCTVVMPEDADPTKVAACRAHGADVVLHGDVGAAFAECFRIRDERDLTFIHPFDDPAIIAGAGSVGLEILEDAPGADVVVVPVGGGGLVSGVAAAVRARRPRARVYGVEPEGAPGLRRALDAGQVVRLERVETIAGGLAPPFAGALALEHARALLADVVLVSDDEILDALRATLHAAKLLAEPSGAAGVAALLAGSVPVGPDDTVVVVLSGGNVDPETVLR